MTPMGVATFMAGMFQNAEPHLRLLDAGAGVGSLTAAWVSAASRRRPKPKTIHVTVFEVEPAFDAALRDTISRCRAIATSVGIEFGAEVITRDFVEFAVECLGDLFGSPPPSFTSTILNPPYRKLNTASRTRRQLESVNAGTTNLYAAFLTLANRMLRPGGEMVAITPRSFCNGPYFKSFRAEFLEVMSLRRIHIFDGRDTAFSDDGVLQENVIVHAARTEKKTPRVMVTSSRNAAEGGCTSRSVRLRDIVRPEDPDLFIWIPTDAAAQNVITKMRSLSQSLATLGLTVSTGRVVEFRARDYLRMEPAGRCAPLVYPGHFSDGFVKWPRPGYRKPNAIIRAPDTTTLLVPSSIYVLVKRFSSKEERRRIVAAVYDCSRLDAEVVGFENHLNYFHEEGAGLSLPLAKGLSAFLNTTTVDLYFRQFNGHTQVNATDLRSLPYPTREELCAVGNEIDNLMPAQVETDELVDRVIFNRPSAKRAASA